MSRMAEIRKLIKEQSEDCCSDHVSKDAREVTIDPAKLVGMVDDMQAKKEKNKSITWGKPAKIAVCRDTRSCGVCENRPDNAIYEQTILISGIDFDRTERGSIIGAYCCCGFSF